MSAPRVLTIVSLLANVALLAAVIWRDDAVRPRVANENPPVAAIEHATTGTPRATGTDAQPGHAPAKAERNFGEANIESVVAQLRAAGFPDELVREVGFHLVNRRASARRREILGPPVETAVHQVQSRAPLDPAKQDALAQLERDREELLKKILGPDYLLKSEEYVTFMRQRYGPLSEEKLVALEAINRDYRELTQKLRNEQRGTNGRPSPESREKERLLALEKRKDIEKLLSPEEMLEADLRSSSAASWLRQEAAYFDLTEAEYRALFPAYASRAATAGLLIEGETPRPADRRVQDAELLAEAQKVLTPERYEQFSLARDPKHTKLFQVVRRLELPPATAGTVVAVQTETDARAKALQADATLDASERARQLARLAAEATARVEAVMGARGLQVYREHGGGWLKRLQESSGSP